jgi:hypothetical protein
VRGVKEEGVYEERVEGPQPARQRATFYFS